MSIFVYTCVGMHVTIDVMCSQQVEETSDPLIINAMMYLCKTIHDSLK